MTNEQLAAQMQAMQEQLAALAAENAELKKNPPKQTDFSKPVRVMKNGKIRVRHKTQLDLNILQALMIAVKLKDLMELAKRCRGGKWERRVSMDEKKQTRNSWDDLFIITTDGEEVSMGSVALAKLADNSLDTNPESAQNKKNLNDRISRWNELWKELEDRSKSNGVSK